MATQKTIAIIGAFDDSAISAIRELSGNGSRLLLFFREEEKDRQADKAAGLQEYPGIEWISCPIEASWEADAILLAVPEEEHSAVASIIRNVTTGKPVIDIRNGEQSREALQILFPDSIVERALTGDGNLAKKIISLLK